MTEELVPTESTIGMNAGKVWQALNRLGTATPYALRTETRLSQEDTHEALGWLAREGKLTELRDGKIVKFRLNE